MGGKTRHHVPVQPETVLAQVAPLEVLVLGKLALRVAIAQQLGVDTHPGPSKQEICRQDDRHYIVSNLVHWKYSGLVHASQLGIGWEHEAWQL